MTIAFGYKNTRRRSMNPDLFAGFIGAIAQFYESNSHNYISGEGFAYEDGSCYPSVSHVNGVAGDVYYLATDDSLTRPLLNSSHFDYENQKDFNNLLYDFGFAREERLISENFINSAVGVTASTILPHSRHYTNPRHNNHLHIYGFDHDSIYNINT